MSMLLKFILRLFVIFIVCYTAVLSLVLLPSQHLLTKEYSHLQAESDHELASMILRSAVNYYVSPAPDRVIQHLSAQMEGSRIVDLSLFDLDGRLLERISPLGSFEDTKKLLLPVHFAGDALGRAEFHILPSEFASKSVPVFRLMLYAAVLTLFVMALCITWLWYLGRNSSLSIYHRYFSINYWLHHINENQTDSVQTSDSLPIVKMNNGEESNNISVPIKTMSEVLGESEPYIIGCIHFSCLEEQMEFLHPERAKVERIALQECINKILSLYQAQILGASQDYLRFSLPEHSDVSALLCLSWGLANGLPALDCGLEPKLCVAFDRVLFSDTNLIAQTLEAEPSFNHLLALQSAVNFRSGIIVSAALVDVMDGNCDYHSSILLDNNAKVVSQVQESIRRLWQQQCTALMSEPL